MASSLWFFICKIGIIMPLLNGCYKNYMKNKIVIRGPIEYIESNVKRRIVMYLSCNGLCNRSKLTALC